ncbi:MAG: FkbM family methyltransferase [Gammaproteobacteria bacterium]|nr:FkbM family methyltransferase [Gammaproteobacteria bacterium]NNF48946.1 FkbM family methyltransferase [Woeseiaceae bacterium]MBT8093250.1 FkbM family methyltransferase [Gammaproteobacteria bacterium]MBT8106056.1 FkbM family methyltransferase [Gammaproteobacteria bacterium]NNK26070.1 FkbM family methyltransferase [Woeseiaceae bacterium]
MRTSGWMKRQPWFWPAKLFLKRISGKELWLRREVDFDLRQRDSWKYISELLDSDAIVYSVGVGDLIDFDLGLIDDHNVTVHAFDPTPFARDWVEQQALPDRFVFHPWAAAGADGTLRLYRRVSERGKRSAVMWTADEAAGDVGDFIDAPAYTIETVMRKLGHERVDLLKIDVEGAEYEILASLRRDGALPRQLLVEFHHRFPGIGKRRTLESIANLRDLGYSISGISETGREVSFVLD